LSKIEFRKKKMHRKVHVKKHIDQRNVKAIKYV
jgi:hypothetical protein